MQLSKYFTRQEFERSQTAERRNINNKMGPQELANAKALCKNVLDKIRQFYNSPCFITSGYRSPIINALVGGATLSQHRRGEAVDFIIAGVMPEQVFEDITTGKISGLKWDQVILEGSWVHISYAATGWNRGQKLIARFTQNGVVYEAA